MIRQGTADSGLSSNQLRAAARLAAGKGVHETAKELGAGERTLHTWLRDDAFRALIAELRDRMLSEATGRLSDAATAAVDGLRRLLDDDSASIRLRAAVALLDGMVEIREHAELADRVAELERRPAEYANGARR